MHRAATRTVMFAVFFWLAFRVAAEPPVLVSCDEPPPSVAALGAKSGIEAFAVAPEASVSVIAMASSGSGTGSVLRFARAGGAPTDVKLNGQVLGLSVAPDGTFAYAVVRVTGRKGTVRGVELVRVDLDNARASSGTTLPITARGLAIGSNGSMLLVASRDEIRSFQLPSLASGPLYRALGENVGVAPVPDSSFVLLAQPSRLVLADLAAPQGRDGLVLSHEVKAPAPLRGMLASAGDRGPIAISDAGLAWCVQTSAPPPLPLPPAPVVPESPAEPSVEDVPAVEAPAARPVEPGTVFGVVNGPGLGEVAGIIFLGPDNVLREAARVIPDSDGRFASPTLPPGAYRIVAAGKGGRVLICEPSFITIRVDSYVAVEAPELKVVRAQ